MTVEEQLFGEAAALWLAPLRQSAPSLRGYRYTFMPETKYTSLLVTDVAKGMEVYWRELLFRAHLAAAVSLLRFERWISGAVASFEAENTFAFSACLRGAIESAADSLDALDSVPNDLADSHAIIRRALVGKLNDFVAFPDLEGRLIHFSHARRLEKGEEASASHQAKTSAEYLRKFGTRLQAVQPCYSDLCKITHPAAFSVVPFLLTNADGSVLEIAKGHGERETLAHLANSYRDAMLPMFAAGMAPAILTLRVLNRLPLASVRTASVEAYLSESPVWAELKERLRNPAEPQMQGPDLTEK